MAIKPGPASFTLGANNLLADSITLSYDTEVFDRVEFDHDKLKSAPLSTGTAPIIVTMLGGVPAEIVIDCALSGMIGGASSYIPRPLVPNAYTADTNNIKQRSDISRIQVTGQSPESAAPAAIVDALFVLREAHKNALTQFQNRLAIFNTTIAYELLLAAQTDNIQALYFTTGITFTSPDLVMTNCLITDLQITHEFVIPNESGGTDVYKGFSMTLEQRIVTAASSP